MDLPAFNGRILIRNMDKKDKATLVKYNRRLQERKKLPPNKKYYKILYFSLKLIAKSINTSYLNMKFKIYRYFKNITKWNSFLNVIRVYKKYNII